MNDSIASCETCFHNICSFSIEFNLNSAIFFFLQIGFNLFGNKDDLTWTVFELKLISSYLFYFLLENILDRFG